MLIFKNDSVASVMVGDCLASLATLPDASINCCVTSPPYYGLRDYGVVGQIGLEESPDAYVARLVEVFARRLQTQETMTAQIIDALNENLNPRGAAVLLEAEHMCMTMRGVRAHGVATLTHRFTGVFAEDRNEQDRFFALIGKR